MNRLFAVLAVASLGTSALASTTYNDPAGDVFTGAGGGILDILSMEVSNTATDITFKFTLAGDVVATDWGKYMIAIDNAPGGDVASNGWARPISMPTGMDHWIGTWVDSGNGAEVYAFSGAWARTQATYDPAPNNQVSISKMGNMVTVSTPLSALGLNVGDIFFFDAFTSGGGGGDGAVDSLGNPNQQIGDWGVPSEAHPLTYLVIPAPGAAGALALGGLLAMRRRR